MKISDYERMRDTWERLEGLAAKWMHDKEVDDSNEWPNPELPCRAECKRCQLEVILKDANGGSDQRSAAQSGVLQKEESEKREKGGGAGMTFAEWWQKYGTVGPRDEAIARSAWNAATFEANERAGDSANEAEKDARRKAAMEKIKHLIEDFYGNAWTGADEIEAFIKEAQG